MQSILIIQFRRNETVKEAERVAIQQKMKDKDVSLTFVNALENVIDWTKPKEILEGYDGVVLGASGDLYFDDGRSEFDPMRKRVFDVAEEMRPFLEYLIEQEFPTLGICLGHQLLAYVLGNTVNVCSRQAKTGTYTVWKTQNAQNDPLFGSLPDEFSAQYAHKDVLKSIPGRAQVLASSEQCDFAAVKFAPNVYSVQFHPELSAEEMKERGREHPEYLPKGKTAEEIFHPSLHSTEILRNFVKIAKDAARAR